MRNKIELSANLANVLPALLRDTPRWLCCNVRKEPVSAHRPKYTTSAHDPENWTTFEHAYKVALESNGTLGLGFFLNGEDGIAALDGDSVLDEERTARECFHPLIDYLDEIDAYVELSFGDYGYRAVVRTSENFGKFSQPIGPAPCKLEAWTHGQFVTITGRMISDGGGIPEVDDLHATLTRFVAEGNELQELEPRRKAHALNGARTHAKLTFSRCATPEEGREALIIQLREIAYQSAVQTTSRHEWFGWYGMQLIDNGIDVERAKMEVLKLVERLRHAPWNPKRVCKNWEGIGWVRWKAKNGARELHPDFARFLEIIDSETDDQRKLRMALPWPADFPMSETGNARRFQSLFLNRHLYVPGNGWMEYRDGAWLNDVADVLTTAAGLEIERGLKIEAAYVLSQVEDEKERAKLASRWASFITRSGSANGTKGMLYIARSLEGMHESPDAFDRKPYLLNCLNCTVDLRTKQDRPHDPLDRLSKRTRAAFLPSASRRRFERFVLEIMGGNQSMADYVQKVLGYAGTGETKERLFWIFSGIGSNGKDTLLGAAANAMGNYWDRLNSELFVQPKHGMGEKASPEKAKLKGLRLAITSELPEDGKLNEAELKGITGGDDITTRALYKDSITFEPSHKLIAATNHRPSASDDTALWDRLKLIEFKERFTNERRDSNLKNELRAEAEGILSWLIDGAHHYYVANGIDHEPEQVRKATLAYRSTENIVASWAEVRTVADPTALHTFAELYADFQSWCGSGEHAQREVSANKFARQIGRLGFEEDRAGSARKRRGFRLTHEPSLNYMGWEHDR